MYMFNGFDVYVGQVFCRARAISLQNIYWPPPPPSLDYYYRPQISRVRAQIIIEKIFTDHFIVVIDV